MDTKELKIIKQKRRFYLLCFVLILLFIGAFNLFKTKSYTKNYNINDVGVEESYDKLKKSYFFKFNYEDKSLGWAIVKNYSWKKKLIKKIDVFKTDKETCLIIDSDNLSFYPLCYDDEGQFSYLLASDEMKANFSKIGNREEMEPIKYNDITIYDYYYHDFYIWNYRGFDHLSLEKNEKINLFNEDVYDPKLIIQTKDYLLVPNYEANYYFSKVYLINSRNGKVINWDFKKQIYFDSKLLGVFDNVIYLLDNKEKIEWKINLEKRKIEKIGTQNKQGLFYDNGWVRMSLNKILENNEFKGVNTIDYVSDQKLKALILDQEITLVNEDVKIVATQNNKVFYLIKDNLYEYNFDIGQVKLLNKFEWNFNNQNIFIF